MTEKKKVLFVCSANTCRSPMAAAVLSELGGDRYIASSAGIFAFDGQPIGRMAAMTLESVSYARYNYIMHRSRTVTEKMMNENDIVVGMSKGHADTLRSMFPQYADKVEDFPIEMKDFARGDIVAYQLGFVDIKKGVTKLFLSEASR